MVSLGRRRISALTPKLLVVLLCVGVFVWGLTAKISVYQSQTPAHTRVVAKLITDAQLNDRHCATGTIGRVSAVPIPLQRASALWSSMPAVHHGRAADGLILPEISSYPHSLYFRPPPADA